MVSSNCYRFYISQNKNNKSVTMNIKLIKNNCQSNIAAYTLRQDMLWIALCVIGWSLLRSCFVLVVVKHCTFMVIFNLEKRKNCIGLYEMNMAVI